MITLTNIFAEQLKQSIENWKQLRPENADVQFIFEDYKKKQITYVPRRFRDICPMVHKKDVEYSFDINDDSKAYVSCVTFSWYYAQYDVQSFSDICYNLTVDDIHGDAQINELYAFLVHETFKFGLDCGSYKQLFDALNYFFEDETHNTTYSKLDCYSLLKIFKDYINLLIEFRDYTYIEKAFENFNQDSVKKVVNIFLQFANQNEDIETVAFLLDYMNRKDMIKPESEMEL